MVKNALYEFDILQFKSALNPDTDFIRFRHMHNSIHELSLWKIPHTSKELKLIHFIVKCVALVSQTTRKLCHMCQADFEDTLHHITTACESTLTVRTELWNYLVDTLSPNCSIYSCDIDNEYLLHVLLGKKVDCIINDFNETTEYDTFRKMCAVFMYASVTAYYSSLCERMYE